MQIGFAENLVRRILHYWGRGYTEEIKKGDDYAILPRMINIVVVDFNVFHSNECRKTTSASRPAALASIEVEITSLSA
ncbi:MAG: Rpn family recombination-promoting nuclease/putative transposase [Synergistaceae bacterium]|nr:Rpn family recombination-promoting nuclease/putative transposase [Synergistaceae bacterium]